MPRLPLHLLLHHPGPPQHDTADAGADRAGSSCSPTVAETALDPTPPRWSWAQCPSPARWHAWLLLQALSYCDEQSHALHRNYYLQRIWQKLAYGRALAATGDAAAARASLEQAAALAAEHRVRPGPGSLGCLSCCRGLSCRPRPLYNYIRWLSRPTVCVRLSPCVCGAAHGAQGAHAGGLRARGAPGPAWRWRASRGG